MAQASALAIGETCALPHGSASVVQTPLKTLYRDCTTYGFSDLADATTTSLLEDLTRWGGPLSPGVEKALRCLVEMMVAMAEGTAPPSFYLSSLDPGVGKTTTLVHFVRALLRSEEHEDVAVLVGLSRLDEIKRLVDEIGLASEDFAVFTGKGNKVNDESSTPPDQARILFTTQSMIKSRCRSGSFRDAGVFHYHGEVRAVRIWDEEMVPGEVVAITTDQLASLREPLRRSHPALVEVIEEAEQLLIASADRGTCTWPEVEATTGVTLWSAKRGQDHRHAAYLDSLYALSGRSLRVSRSGEEGKVITALDSRDAIPDDLAPVVILDASGRVRETYRQMEKAKGNLVRLPSAIKSYRNLTVHVMDKGSGKSAWSQENAGVLAQEIAQLIDSKPEEQWLVIHHGRKEDDTIPNLIRGLMGTDPIRVHFLNWGRHQGTNAFRKVKNVVLAGMNNYRETDYEMMARYYSGTGNDQKVPKPLVDQIAAGELNHHILQALCRSAVRQGNGSSDTPCNAYIIAPKRSGVRDFLPEVFPGCTVLPWLPTKAKPKGKVQEALTFIEMFFEDYPDQVLRFTELRQALGGTSVSNFNSRIRHHPTFKAGLEDLGIEEVTVGNYSHRNAFARKQPTFGPVLGSSYIADV